MNGAAMVNDHGARRNRADRRRLRIKPGVALDGVRLLGTTIQPVRKHSQQMRARNVPHGAVLDRAVRQRNPDADFLVLKTGLAERLILMPRGGAALVYGLENRVISRKSGLGTQQLPRDGDSRFTIRPFAQFRRVQRRLKYGRQNGVSAAVPRNEIEISALAAPFAAFEHAHQNIAAPLEIAFRNLRRFNDEKPLPKELGNLISAKRLFQ